MSLAHTPGAHGHPYDRDHIQHSGGERPLADRIEVASWINRLIVISRVLNGY